MPAFRLPGGGIAASQNALSPVAGSFQRLKELIRTERARELQAQRAAEEIAARAATLKEIANGNTYVNEHFNCCANTFETYRYIARPVKIIFDSYL